MVATQGQPPGRGGEAHPRQRVGRQRAEQQVATTAKQVDSPPFLLETVERQGGRRTGAVGRRVLGCSGNRPARVKMFSLALQRGASQPEQGHSTSQRQAPSNTTSSRTFRCP